MAVVRMTRERWQNVGWFVLSLAADLAFAWSIVRWARG